jgi:4,5-dihydroxyphthalate decarboxylase
VTKAFEQAKSRTLVKLGDVAASKVSLPFVKEQLLAVPGLMGEDFWWYGLDANRHLLEVFLRRDHAEWRSSRPPSPEELFHPATHEAHRD